MRHPLIKLLHLSICFKCQIWMVNVEFFGNFLCSCLRGSASVALNRALSTADGLSSPLKLLEDHPFFTTLQHPFVIQSDCISLFSFVSVLVLILYYLYYHWGLVQDGDMRISLSIFSHGHTDPTAIYGTTSSEKKNKNKKSNCQSYLFTSRQMRRELTLSTWKRLRHSLTITPIYSNRTIIRSGTPNLTLLPGERRACTPTDTPTLGSDTWDTSP